MRSLRKLQDGARYHVSSRINRKEMALAPDAIKVLFLDIVERAKRKYGFSIENFCIMENHFHMIIRPSDACGLPKIMQWIKSVFAVAYNKLNGLTGHTWGARYFSKILGSLTEYLHDSMYIDENPVVAGLAGSPIDWPYCACAFRANGNLAFLDPPPSSPF